MVYKFVKKSNLEYYFGNPEEMNNRLPMGPSMNPQNGYYTDRRRPSGKVRKKRRLIQLFWKVFLLLYPGSLVDMAMQVRNKDFDCITQIIGDEFRSRRSNSCFVNINFF